MTGKRKLTGSISSPSKRRNSNPSQISLEDLFLRYPHLSEAILNKLDDKALVECKNVSRTWCNVIDGQRFLWIRILKKYIQKRKKCNEIKYSSLDIWKKAVDKTPIKIIKELALSVWKTNKENARLKLEDRAGDSPLHALAFKGDLEAYTFISEKIKMKNPANNFGTTPLHDAAENGHLEICEYISKHDKIVVFYLCHNLRIVF